MFLKKIQLLTNRGWSELQIQIMGKNSVENLVLFDCVILTKLHEVTNSEQPLRETILKLL